MASKTYTAQEMREAANMVDDVSINKNGEFYYEKYDKFNPDLVRDMLRQAADVMEREKKREKKYEYSVHPADVYGVFQHRSAAELNVNFFKALGVRAHLVRREVGEWEEVTK